MLPFQGRIALTLEWADSLADRSYSIAILSNVTRWWTCILCLVVCSQLSGTGRHFRSAGLERIQHFVFILEPGPSFNSDFGRYPHVEGTAEPCPPESACQEADTLSNYWAWARLYVIQDFFFATPSPLRDFLALTGSLDRAAISWRIYEADDASAFLRDCQRATLPAVSWVMTGAARDSHQRIARTTTLVNAVMDSSLLYRSVVFLASDGSEGGADHVLPPDGLGPRVASLVIGPYSREDYHHHQMFSFASWLRTLEVRFELEPLDRTDPFGTVLTDAFDFSQEARPPVLLSPSGADSYPLEPQPQFYGLGWLGAVHSCYGTFHLARDAMVDGYVRGITGQAQIASSYPLPFELGGVRITVRDSAGVRRDAPILYAGPNQVNFAVPDGTAAGPASIVATGPLRQVWTNVEIQDVSPGLYSTTAMGQGPADGVITYERNGERNHEPAYLCEPDGLRPCPSRPIELDQGNTTLSLYGTGIRHRSSLENVQVRIGNVNVTVLYAGLAESYPWIDQVDVALPAELAGRSTQLVYLIVDGKTANPVQVVFR